MTVNRLGDNRVLVTLRDSEMNDYLLDFQIVSMFFKGMVVLIGCPFCGYNSIPYYIQTNFFTL